MLKSLYDWTLSLAARKSAEWWLAFISFVESSVFVIPAEVLFVPMGLARPGRAYRDAVLLMLITSGLAHLPPMKVVSIVSGALSIDLWLFVGASLVARGFRFAVM